MSTLYPWMVWKDDTKTERRSGRWDVYSVSVNGLKRRYEYRETKRKMRCLTRIREWSEKTIRIQRDEAEDEMSTLYTWMVWKDDTNTKGRISEWSEKTIEMTHCYYARVYMFQLRRESSTKRITMAFYPAPYVMIVWEQVKGLSQKR